MQWQLFISSSLEVHSGSPKIISDLTGILVSDAFLDYLNINNIVYTTVNSLPELLVSTNSSSTSLVLTTIKEIPAFINNRFQKIKFNYSDIPLNGNVHNELKNLPADTIITVLEYIFATDRHCAVQANKLPEITANAVLFRNKNELYKLKQQLISLLEAPQDINNILFSAQIWGNIIHHSYIQNDDSFLSLIPQMDAYSDEFFLNNKMQSVFYASTPRNPKTVDKILHNINVDNKEKVALLCFDCMGFAEWLVLKEYISDVQLEFDEVPVFALLPSVTVFSRQAIFSGSTDVYNIKVPNRSNEISNFASFFNDKETKSFSEKDEITSDTLIGYKYINILYNFFDELCHSVIFPLAENTKSLYFDAIKAYLSKSNLIETIRTLLKNDFSVYFCSDHGSVLASGNGIKLEKYYVDRIAKRAVVIPEKANELIENKKINIPFVKDKLIVLPEGRTMFTYKNKKEINHGGISIEEMVVPYIKVRKKI